MREGGDVKVFDFIELDSLFDFVAGEKKTSFILVITHARRSADEHLLNARHRELSLLAKNQDVHWHLAPAKLEESTIRQNLLDDRLRPRLGISVVVGQEDKADSKISIVVKYMPEFCDLLRKSL